MDIGFLIDCDYNRILRGGLAPFRYFQARDLGLRIGEVPLQALDLGGVGAEQASGAFGGVGVAAQLVFEFGLGGLQFAQMGVPFVRGAVHEAFFRPAGLAFR